jgi:hypothetical protein
MIEAALTAYLLSVPDIAARVGDRIRPQKSPERKVPYYSASDPGAFPHVTYRRTDTNPRVITQDGQTGLVKTVVELTCWGLTYASAKDLANTIRVSTDPDTGMRLDGWKQAQMNMTFVQMARLEGDSDSFDRPEHGDDVGVYSTSFNVFAWWNEAS